ncbi:MAG: tetratricopeptide repeat protein [Thiohalomonadales bacterium]
MDFIMYGHIHFYKIILLLIIFGFITNPAFGDEAECGSIKNHYGPFDYTNPVHVKNKLPIVEKYHFTKNVANLISGESSFIYEDLHYTLKTFPNHHRALYSMMMYQIKNPISFNKKNVLTIDCYFDLALRFKPTDSVVLMLKGIYLEKIGKSQEALDAYLEALSFNQNYTELFYNIGLQYFELKNYDKALEFAQKAYDNDFPLPALKDKLTKMGKWKNTETRKQIQ